MYRMRKQVGSGDAAGDETTGNKKGLRIRGLEISIYHSSSIKHSIQSSQRSEEKQKQK